MNKLSNELMNNKRSKYISAIIVLSFLLSVSSLLLNQDVKAQALDIPPDTKPKTIEQTKEDKEAIKKEHEKRAAEPPIENVISVTTEQITNKPEDYLNKNVKFTAPFFAFSNLALDYKPAFRSSRTYLSFLVLRSNGHTPFSEIKLAMLIPKEKDPETKMLQTLKEGDTVEITGHVFACSLDEPWLDVLRLKKIASAKKSDNAEDKASE